MERIFWTVFTPELLKYETIELTFEALGHLDNVHHPHKKPLKVLKLDNVFVHYFVKELSISSFYRTCVIRNVIVWKAPEAILLRPTKKDLIDYNWNERIYQMVRERCEVDHAFSWLSTLGGAFSALGDYFENCADTAGKISIHQLKLALRLNDPNILSRCRLYLGLSLIQKKRFEMAKRIVRFEYETAKKQLVVDERLINMCKGIWAKLRYEHSIYIRTVKR